MCKTGDTSGPGLVGCAVGYIMLEGKKPLPPADISEIFHTFFLFCNSTTWLGSENKKGN